MSVPSLCRFLAALWFIARALALPPGALDLNYLLPGGTDATPQILLPAPAGKLYAVGPFTNYANTGRKYLVRLNVDGSLDAGFTLPPLLKITQPTIIGGQVLLPGSTNAGTILAALVLPDGRAVIAGVFTHVGTAARPGLAVLEVDGSPAPFNVSLDKIEPDALLAGPNGTFYVSGRGFANANHLPILRLKTDGSRDPGFATPTVASVGYRGTFESLLRPGPDGSIYFVANVTLLDFNAAYEIVRLLSSGALDTTFADAGRAQAVKTGNTAYLSTPSGQLVFSGLVSYRGANLPRSIYRLGLNGAMDPTFQCAVDPGVFGRVVAVQADDQVLFVGEGRLLYRLKAGGALDDSYADPAEVPVPQVGLVLSFYSLAEDQSVYAGGFLAGPENNPRYGVFHLLGDPGVEPPAGKLSYTLIASGFELTWPAGYKLQRSTLLVPANWQDAAPVSPLSVAFTGTTGFFRIVPAP